MKKLFCLLACLLLALCCCGAVAEDASCTHSWEYSTDGWRGVCTACGATCEHYNPNWEAGFKYDADSHWMLCADCGLKVPENQGPHEAVCWLDTCLVCGAPYTSDTVAHYNGGAVQYITDATSHWFVCSKCGETTAPEAHWIGCWNADNTHCLTCGAECEPNHNWAVTSTTEATCTTDGMTVYTCSSCDETKTETTPALGHEWEVVSDYLSECANCDATCDHSNLDWDIGYQYDEDGHWLFCADCGVIAPWQRAEHNNSCTSPNNCEDCGAPYSGGGDSGLYYHDFFSADNYGEFCSNETSHWYTCRACGEIAGPEPHYNYCDLGETECRLCGYECGPMHDEGWKVTSTTEATCTTEGVIEYVCRYCGETKTEATPALDHEWEVVSDYLSECANCDATCDHSNLDWDIGYQYDEDGHWMFCADCGVIAPWNRGEHVNSCRSPNNCVDCGAPCSGGRDSALYYHDLASADYYGEFCSNETGHWYTCRACGEIAGPEPHYNYCDLGETECRLCGYECGPMHDEGWKVTSTTEATCTTDGVTEYVCRYCGETKTEVHTPALGHDFVYTAYNYNSGYVSSTECADYTCSVCKAPDPSRVVPHQVSCIDDSYCRFCQAPNSSISDYELWHGGMELWFDEANCGFFCTDCNQIISSDKHYAGSYFDGCLDGGTICENCGSEFDPHSWEITSETEATCTTNSEVVYTCSVCGKTHSEVHELATGHQWEYNTDGWRGVCADCGEICEHYYPDSEAGYQYDAERHWMLCADCGLRVPENYAPHENMCYSQDACWLCGAPYSSGEYSHVHYWYNPYITDENGHWYVCEECGVTTDPEPHWVGCWNEDNTHCLYCGAECEPSHNWEVTSTTEATCTTDGVTVYTCFSCDETKTETTPALGHNYEYVFEPGPSCDVPGITGEICSNCGDTLWSAEVYHPNYYGQYTGYDENIHWGDCPDCGERIIEESHENTCTSQNNCWLCGAPYSSGKFTHLKHGSTPYITDENGHWYVCDECGVTTDPEPHWIGCWNEDNTHCLDCGVECEPNHNWEVTSQTEATCTTDGVTVYTCSACDETKTETTPALGHNYEYVLEPGPSCDVPGICGEICSNCGDALWSAEVYHANYNGEYTGYDENIHWGDCPDCGERMREEAHENTCYSQNNCWLCGAPYSSGEYIHLRYASTPYITDENGHWYVCDECGVTTDPEPHWIGCWNEDNTHCLYCGVECEPSHNWEVTSQTEATCTTDGVTVYTCSACDETKTEIETAPGHAMSDPVTVDPTCTEDGSITATCATCGEAVVEVLPATGHTFEDGGKTEPTCTEDGYQRGVCTVCGETLDEPIPATGHSFEETERVDPTCDVNGSATYVCSACGESKAEVLGRTGHAWGHPKVTKATCTENGREVKVCANCGVSDSTTLSATGHSMVAQENGDQVCSVCGYTEAAPVVEEPVVEEPVVEEIVIGESEPVEAVVVKANIEPQPDAEPIADTIDLVVYEPLEDVPAIPETIAESVETVYVVSLLDAGEPIQPSGSLRLRILLAEDADLTGQVLMLVNADGTMVEIAYEVIDGYLVFDTEVTGIFVLVNAAE